MNISDSQTSRLIACKRCGTLYDPDWKSACAAGICPGKTPDQKIEDLQQRVEDLERMHHIHAR